MNENSIDLSKMNLLEMPERWNTVLEVRIKENGEIYICTRLIKKIFEKTGSSYIKFYYSDDYRTIALQGGSECDLKFTQSGKLKHQKYVNKFEELGYKLPAKYHVEWDEKMQAWIGKLQEVCPAPVPASKGVSKSRNCTSKNR